uniref:Ribonuclease n=1 Tax=Coccidioides posadasii RMSCC 3488 TaxID=454284 RepID=A0A0J6F1I9_COCPO|nr:ribonuclease H2 subunit A [Coccidioides posadasii RMSCC 3488]
MGDSEDEQNNVSHDAPSSSIYHPPSIHRSSLLSGQSYAHYSSCPAAITPCAAGNSTWSHPDHSIPPTPCVLGVDEAGRGPVLGPMAMDATVEIIRGVVEERGVDVKEVYIDTIGNPQTYQKKLERIFPSLKITVAKKADALFPCVSAASVCAKVTRDAALEICYEELQKQRAGMVEMEHMNDGWGSGYPSDSKCVTWLKKEMHPLFGWGNECRFSWGTAKDLLEVKAGLKVDWHAVEDDDTKMTQFFITASTENAEAQDELRDWYGRRPKEIF